MTFHLRKDLGRRVPVKRSQAKQDAEERAYRLSRPAEERVDAVGFLTRRKHLVIGGHAVGFHGRPRDAGGIDIVIKPTKEDAERLVRAVSAFGAGGLGCTEDDYLSGDFIQFVPSKECLLASGCAID